MELTKTVKIQFKLVAKADAALLRQTMDQYHLACDNVSRYVFDHDFVLNTTKLQMVLYRSLRARFGLKAQMAQSRQAKDLTWLWHPIRVFGGRS